MALRAVRILGRIPSLNGSEPAPDAAAVERVPVMPAIKPTRSRDPALQERLRKIAETRSRERESAGSIECKRRTRRKQTSLPAVLTFRTMRAQIPCTIVDMSGTGARLRLPPATARAYGDAESLPGHCTLVLRIDRIQVDCEVMWRNDMSLGVRFLGPPVPITL
ncbi:MAG: PilZ domain-containing protein [Hyphomicrobiaceae bacterium]|nr:PilZ domain-containing protein [Hyphomicrobiaceae bacterium]